MGALTHKDACKRARANKSLMRKTLQIFCGDQIDGSPRTSSFLGVTTLGTVGKCAVNKQQRGSRGWEYRRKEGQGYGWQRGLCQKQSLSILRLPLGSCHAPFAWIRAHAYKPYGSDCCSRQNDKGGVAVAGSTGRKISVSVRMCNSGKALLHSGGGGRTCSRWR